MATQKLGDRGVIGADALHQGGVALRVGRIDGSALRQQRLDLRGPASGRGFAEAHSAIEPQTAER